MFKSNKMDLINTFIKKLNWLLSLTLLGFFTNCSSQIEPDNPPVIQQYQPSQLELIKNINDVINFQISAIDADDDPIDYKFLKNNEDVSNDDEYEWVVDKKGSNIILGIAYNGLADTVKWNVNVENSIPVATDTSLNMLEEAVITIDKSELGHDPDSDDLTYRVLEKENVDADFNENLTITGLLDYFGPASIKYEVSDGVSKDTGNISIQIENIADLPRSILNSIEGTIDSPINLDGTNSYHPDSPLNEIVSYEWEQLEGPDVNIEDNESAVANFTPLTSGIYKFILTVTDNLNQQDKDTLTATINSYLINLNVKDVLNDENIDGLEVIISGKSAFTENGGAGFELPTDISGDTLLVRDENGVEIGDYFDYKRFVYKELFFPGNLELDVLMIPNLEIVGDFYGNILNLIKSMTRSRGNQEDNGNTTMARWSEIPIDLFFNRSTAPDGYTDALIQAIGDAEVDTLEGWENKTGFLYKGKRLEPLNLFYEVLQDPKVGLAMDYSGNLSHNVIDESLSDGTPKHGVVYIDNNLGYPILKIRDHLHEFGHALRYGRGTESIDTTHVMQPGNLEIVFEEGAAVRIMYMLPNKQNMVYYIED